MAEALPIRRGSAGPLYAILDGVAIVSQDPQYPYNLDRLRRIDLSDDSVADLWLGNYGPLYFPESASLARSADRTSRSDATPADEILAGEPLICQQCSREAFRCAFDRRVRTESNLRQPLLYAASTFSFHWSGRV